MRAIALLGILLAGPVLAAEQEPRPLVVHEWGTFTSLQDVDGRAIAGLNSNDEPLPEFVHRFQRKFIVNDAPSSKTDIFSKSVAYAHGDVTMRLETPVMYFHPADNAPITLDVKATYNTGILSEFYPKADFAATIGGKPTTQPAKRISSESASTLVWKDVKINRPCDLDRCCPDLPQTKEHVWLAPRAVKSAPINVGKEWEQYLFYRGVGHLDAPIKVVRRDDMIGIYDQRPMHAADGPMKINGMWLADFREDGSCAFRAIDDQPSYGKVKAKMHPATFSPEDYSAGNVAKLRAEMHKALIADGLYDDEAAAMLETWKLSYFKSGGQRLFFLVPRQWTDDVIPLEFSRPVELTRVMVGRIELVTPTVRQNLKTFASLQRPAEDAKAAEIYKSLGRFADALILDQQRRAQQLPPAGVSALPLFPALNAAN